MPSLMSGHVCCQAGKVPKFIKSEETPKDNDGPVKVVTANTFEEVIFGGKDVLIEFYAPWCGHCKSLAPIYEQVHPRLFICSVCAYAELSAQSPVAQRVLTEGSTSALQLGEAFKDNESVVIAKMDATANDVPSSKFSVRCSLEAFRATWHS